MKPVGALIQHQEMVVASQDATPGRRACLAGRCPVALPRIFTTSMTNSAARSPSSITDSLRLAAWTKSHCP